MSEAKVVSVFKDGAWERCDSLGAYRMGYFERIATGDVKGIVVTAADDSCQVFEPHSGVHQMNQDDYWTSIQPPPLLTIDTDNVEPGTYRVQYRITDDGPWKNTPAEPTELAADFRIVHT